MFRLRNLLKFKKNNEETIEEESELDREFRSMCEKIEADKLGTINYAARLSFAFYILVLILIGLPIWYKTTTPERWPLPDVSQLMVKSQTLEQYYKISIVSFVDDLNLDSIRATLQSNHRMKTSMDGKLLFSHDWTVRRAFTNEIDILQELQTTNHTIKLLIDLDERLSRIHGTNTILFYILPQSIQTQQPLNVGNYRSYFIDSNHPNHLQPSELVSSITLQVAALENIVERFYNRLDENDEDITLFMSKSFDLMLDIIYEDEYESFNLNGTNFDRIESIRKREHHKLMEHISAFSDYFSHSHHPLNRYFQINVVPQVLHYVWSSPDFINKQLITSSQNSQRQLPVSSIEKLLTQIESRRIQFNDNLKSYHLVLYVSSVNKPPLKFLEGQRTSNLITTPHRGSILILNQDPKRDLYLGFRQLLRTFFRLPPEDSQVQRIAAQKLTFVPQLELESCVRALTQKHILQTLSSLESTEKLLNKVSNMVIEEKISNWLHESMDNSLRASDMLSSNGNIMNAYQHSLVAYTLSEKAFFHPSLLSLLYFPDDQKYAIYLPLFLPIVLPLLATASFYILRMAKKSVK